MVGPKLGRVSADECLGLEGRRANLGLARRRFWRGLLARVAGAKDLVGGAEDTLGGTLGERLAMAP